MYESNDSGINILGIIKKVILVIIAILVIFGILTLVTRCSKNVSNKKNNTNTEIKEEVNLTDELQIMEDELLKNITIDNLPKDLGASRTIKLKYLIDKGAKVIKDDNGTTCNENKSNAEITKLENNYAIKLSLTCGMNSKYKIIYVGCFESCANGGICKGLESTKGGVCAQEKEESTSEESTNGASQNTNVNNTNNSVNTTQTQSQVKPSQNSAPTNSNSTSSTNTSKPNNVNTNQTNKVTEVVEYQFKKCTNTYKCLNGGTPNSNNKCLVTNTVLDKLFPVVKQGTTKTTYYCATGTLDGTQCKIPTTNKVCNWVNKGIVYFNRTVDAVNTSTVRYRYKDLVTGKGYSYTKEVYECSYKSDTKTVAAGVIKDTTPTVYSCFDSSYKYNSNSGYCEKSIINTYYENAVVDNTSCEYTWSTSTTLPGWTYTGVSKLIRK